ncbi:hypothetical protein EMIHUDRAFT_205848 [Emiliania huxleyi CCMP1516]|uniref:Uncharacterized protein n=2 Tax=Emiliania huxleyi TaxID=2903 RepID=A0A0D3JQG0_EMIH1|nr:hypothetical protein EMIHUDRAFT_205848 [Emiliania huxleyi CCMP1516]EOD25745.1 hypothetical protein EMIHUDRAFT_205848 [Emiliania huxleyi CCMP1516]|eukprot:XP_005778174.1 hypothetical protein EMIHUDRAFT_205848 [Emiliania huxleyi CCMP1516]
MTRRLSGSWIADGSGSGTDVSDATVVLPALLAGDKERACRPIPVFSFYLTKKAQLSTTGGEDGH